jgi:hypothetical protein
VGEGITSPVIMGGMLSLPLTTGSVGVSQFANGVSITAGNLTEVAGNGIVAFADGNQSNGTLIGNQISRVTKVGTSNDAILLPPSAGLVGITLEIINANATQLAVYPAVGEVINALAANVGIAVAGGTITLFTCAVSGTWNAK